MNMVAAISRIFVLGFALGTSVSRAAPAPLSDPFFFYTRPAEYDSVAKTSGIHAPVRTPDGGSSYISCTLLPASEKRLGRSG